MDLFSPVTALKGVGAVRAKQLAKLHIETLYDLIAFFPRDYEDPDKASIHRRSNARRARLL